jgi:shikimate kinase
MNIALIGFMGAGKSWLGVKMAEERGMTLVSTDNEIERRAVLSIPDIFSRYGEKHFRKLEREVFISLLDKDNQIIDCGGGLPIYSEDLFNNSNCYVIFLDTPFDIIWERVSIRSNRPLASGKTREELLELYNTRRPIYLKLADEIIK